MSHIKRERMLKEIYDEELKKKQMNESQETIRVPRLKMVSDGVLHVPRESISTPSIAVNLIKNEIKIQHNHYGDGREVMVLILLNIDNYPIMTKTVAVGSADQVYVDPADVFGLVLSPHFNAKGFIMGHNHPSGEVFLSEADGLMLRQFKKCGDDFSRPMRDFIVVGDGSEKYYSHRNESYEL